MPGRKYPCLHSFLEMFFSGRRKERNTIKDLKKESMHLRGRKSLPRRSIDKKSDIAFFFISWIRANLLKKNTKRAERKEKSRRKCRDN
jgi:hypothetical protein